MTTRSASATSAAQHVERAGRRLLGAADPDAVAWAMVTELHRLVDADLVAVLACAPDCSHTDGCDRPECRRRLRVRASVGNRTSDFAGATFDARAGWLAGVVDAPPGSVRTAGPDAPEGLGRVATFPMRDEHGPRALALLGRRGDATWEPPTLERATALCRVGEVALVAAEHRTRAAEVAVLRERRRLAREMHDTVGQLLFGAGAATRAARESAATNRADVLERLVQAEQAIGRANSALRHAMRSLDAPRGSGAALPVSLQDAVDAFRHRTGIAAGVVLVGARRPLETTSEHLLLRVVAEGLRNAERHSGAREVMVTLSFEPGAVAVSVQDDGGGPGGAGTEPTGLGLDTLRGECRASGGDLTLSGDADGATLRAWMAAP